MSETKHVPERQLRNYKRLAKIDPFQVVQVAAALRRNGGDEIEAIRSTYILWDIALHCCDSLANEASVEAGIKSYQKGVKVDEEFYTALGKSSHYEPKRGPSVGRLPDGARLPGKRLPVLFDEGLENAIPLPKSTRDKPTERMTRLKRFLKELLQETRPEMTEEERILEAGAQIERMKQDGIEPNLFAFLKVRFPSWWEESKAQGQSVKGTYGQKKKKEKEGKQVRRKARPPVDKLPEVIQQLIEEGVKLDISPA